jgi:hypothetical protein
VEHGIRSNVLPRAVESPRRRKSKTQLAEQKKTIQHKNAAGLIAKELIVASSLKGAVIPMGSTAEDLPCVHTVLFALLDISPTQKGLWQAPERNITVCGPLLPLLMVSLCPTSPFLRPSLRRHFSPFHDAPCVVVCTVKEPNVAAVRWHTLGQIVDALIWGAQLTITRSRAKMVGFSCARTWGSRASSSSSSSSSSSNSSSNSSNSSSSCSSGSSSIGGGGGSGSSARLALPAGDGDSPFGGAPLDEPAR